AHLLEGIAGNRVKLAVVLHAAAGLDRDANSVVDPVERSSLRVETLDSLIRNGALLPEQPAGAAVQLAVVQSVAELEGTNQQRDQDQHEQESPEVPHAEVAAWSCGLTSGDEDRRSDSKDVLPGVLDDADHDCNRMQSTIRWGIHGSR